MYGPEQEAKTQPCGGMGRGSEMTPTTGTRGRGAGERIISTGTDLFARFGYNGVSTRDIASAAQVNEVTIYRHFPRKHDLYVAVLESELSQVHLRGDLLAGIAEAPNGPSALARAFELVTKTLLNRPKMLRLVHFGILELNADFDPLLRRHLGELIEVIAHYLEPWIEKGELCCPNGKTAVLALIALVVGHDSLQRMFSTQASGLETMFAAYTDLTRWGQGRSAGSSSALSTGPVEAG